MSNDPADVFIPEVVCVRVLGEEAAWCIIRMPSMEVVVYVDFGVVTIGAPIGADSGTSRACACGKTDMAARIGRRNR